MTEPNRRIDHMGFPVAQIERSRAFYDAALAPLGLTVQATFAPDLTDSGGTAIGYGANGDAFFWIGDGERPADEADVAAGIHIAFTAATRAEVEAFHAAALAAGGTDHGAPGLREHYGPHYYAAFVLDPDGANIEAVCNAPE